MLSDFLQNQFLSHYSISVKGITVDKSLTNAVEFDLDDMDSPFSILPFGKGKLSFKGNTEELEVVHYEDFISQCKKPQSFLNGRKRCDYIIATADDDEEQGCIILAELTSALGGTFNLSKPIINHNHDAVYEGGKYEKAEKQLSGSLITLMEVPVIKDYIERKTDKQCIMAYKVLSYDDPVKRMQHPMSRYLEIESAETQNGGAVISNPIINGYGFTFRRISHTAFYQLR